MQVFWVYALVVIDVFAGAVQQLSVEVCAVQLCPLLS